MASPPASKADVRLSKGHWEFDSPSLRSLGITMKTAHSHIEEVLAASVRCFFGQHNIHQIINDYLRDRTLLVRRSGCLPDEASSILVGPACDQGVNGGTQPSQG